MFRSGRSQGFLKLSQIQGKLFRNVCFALPVLTLLLVDGFEDVCKFGGFLNLCGGAGGNAVADSLTAAYFPTVNECSITKDLVTSMVKAEADGGEEEYRDALAECLLEVIEQLDEGT